MGLLDVLPPKHEAHPNVSIGSCKTHNEISAAEDNSIEKPALGGRVRAIVQRIESIGISNALDARDDLTESLLETKQEAHDTAITDSRQTREEISAAEHKPIEKSAPGGRVRAIVQRIESIGISNAFNARDDVTDDLLETKQEVHDTVSTGSRQTDEIRSWNPGNGSAENKSIEKSALGGRVRAIVQRIESIGISNAFDAKDDGADSILETKQVAHDTVSIGSCQTHDVISAAEDKSIEKPALGGRVRAIVQRIECTSKDKTTAFDANDDRADDLLETKQEAHDTVSTGSRQTRDAILAPGDRFIEKQARDGRIRAIEQIIETIDYSTLFIVRDDESDRLLETNQEAYTSDFIASCQRPVEIFICTIRRILETALPCRVRAMMKRVHFSIEFRGRVNGTVVLLETKHEAQVNLFTFNDSCQRRVEILTSTVRYILKTALACRVRAIVQIIECTRNSIAFGERDSGAVVLLETKHKARVSLFTGSCVKIFTSRIRSMLKTVLAGRVCPKVPRVESIGNSIAFNASDDRADGLLDTKQKVYDTAITGSRQTRDEILASIDRSVQNPAVIARVRVKSQRMKSKGKSTLFGGRDVSGDCLLESKQEVHDTAITGSRETRDEILDCRDRSVQKQAVAGRVRAKSQKIESKRKSTLLGGRDVSGDGLLETKQEAHDTAITVSCQTSDEILAFRDRSVQKPTVAGRVRVKSQRMESKRKSTLFGGRDVSGDGLHESKQEVHDTAITRSRETRDEILDCRDRSVQKQTVAGRDSVKLQRMESRGKSTVIGAHEDGADGLLVDYRKQTKHEAHFGKSEDEGSDPRGTDLSAGVSDGIVCGGSSAKSRDAHWEPGCGVGGADGEPSSGGKAPHRSPDPGGHLSDSEVEEEHGGGVNGGEVVANRGGREVGADADGREEEKIVGDACDARGGVGDGARVQGGKRWRLLTLLLTLMLHIFATPLSFRFPFVLLAAGVVLPDAIRYVFHLRAFGRSIRPQTREGKGERNKLKRRKETFRRNFYFFCSILYSIAVVSVHSDSNTIGFRNSKQCVPSETSVYCTGLSGNFLPSDVNKNVDVLFITHCDMSELSVDSFSKFENVTSLYISSSIINIKRDTGILFPLTKLQNLEISNSHVSDDDFHMLGITNNLVKLSLAGNQITRINNGYFDSLPNLESIDLSYNSISEIEAGALGGMPQLQELLLSHNRLEQSFDPDLVHLGGRCVQCEAQQPYPMRRCPPPSPLDVLWLELEGARVLNLEGDPLCERLGDAPLADLQGSCDEGSDCCAHEHRRRFLQGACRREGGVVETSDGQRTRDEVRNEDDQSDGVTVRTVGAGDGGGDGNGTRDARGPGGPGGWTLSDVAVDDESFGGGSDMGAGDGGMGDGGADDGNVGDGHLSERVGVHDKPSGHAALLWLLLLLLAVVCTAAVVLVVCMAVATLAARFLSHRRSRRNSQQFPDVVSFAVALRNSLLRASSTGPRQEQPTADASGESLLQRV